MGWHIVQFIPGRAKVVIVAGPGAFSVEDGDTNVVVQA